MFFHNQEGRLSLAYGGKIYQVGGYLETNLDYFSLMHELTGYITKDQKGRQFFEYLHNITNRKVNKLNNHPWGFADPVNHVVYFNPNDPQGRICKITPDGVQLIKNGDNEDKMLLIPPEKLFPIIYREQKDPRDTLQKGIAILRDSFTNDPASRAVIVGWLLTIPLICEGIRVPLLRFQGNTQAGKTTASRIISILVNGQSKEKEGTVAVNWRDSAKNPLMILDNLETENMDSRAPQDFLIHVADGTIREVCKSGSSTEGVETRPHTALLSNGIEPLPPRMELKLRTAVIRFSEEYKNRDFMETEVIAEIKKLRNDFWSAWFWLIAEALKAIKEKDAWKEVIHSYQEDGDLTRQERLRPYFALSQLCCRTIDPDLEKEFVDGLTQISMQAEKEERETHPIVTVLNNFFSAHDKAVQLDEKAGFDDPNTTERITKSQLHKAFCTFCGDHRLPFSYSSLQKFMARWDEAYSTIKNAGFTIEKVANKIKGNPRFVVQRVFDDTQLSAGKDMPKDEIEAQRGDEVLSASPSWN